MMQVVPCPLCIIEYTFSPSAQEIGDGPQLSTLKHGERSSISEQECCGQKRNGEGPSCVAEIGLPRMDLPQVSDQ